jgi:hypothetical protein
MNMGLSSKLTFENNRATVNERTVVLHNNKKVQTGKGGQKRNVHFYYVYVLAANQPVPLVATRQDFYQAIWDAPERSNRSLKRSHFQTYLESDKEMRSFEEERSAKVRRTN